MEVRQYHMFGHILWGYSLKLRPKKQALYMESVTPIQDPEIPIDSWGYNDIQSV